jgi:hypothetical protein
MDRKKNAKDKIEKMYADAIYNDLAPNIFADQILRLLSDSNSIVTEYAKFCVRCYREKLPLLSFEDFIKQYYY